MALESQAVKKRLNNASVQSRRVTEKDSSENFSPENKKIKS